MSGYTFIIIVGTIAVIAGAIIAFIYRHDGTQHDGSNPKKA